jgi:opine dehydrogenase
VLTHSLSVAVLGAGHGGLALAGHLAQQGHRVTLWNRSWERIAPVAKRGGILLTSPSGETSLAPVTVATDSIATALGVARHILVAVPACAHAGVARLCAPHLRDDQTMLLLPGRTGGALEVRRVLRDAGCRARILLGEANTFPFASRCVGDGTAVIHGAKAEVLAAALPAIRTPELLAAWRPLLPMLTRARSVLHTGLANLGAILHPIITLLNAGRIEGGIPFGFYSEGITPRVAAALAAADAERVALAAEYGVLVAPLPAWIASAYGHHADSIQGAVAGNPAYAGIKAPGTLVHRYLLEDVPTGLIPLLELGNAAGLALPTLRSLAELARVVLGNELWQHQRTLDVLGLNGLSPEEIRACVQTDVRTAAPTTHRPKGRSFFSTPASTWKTLIPHLGHESGWGNRN